MGDAEMQGEERLARAVLNGGAERSTAERRLCELLAPRVHLYALRRLRRYADAADVTQETLAIVVDALRNGKVNDTARISQFALGTSRHLVSRVLRGERARRELREAMDPFEVTPMPEVWSIDMRTLAHCFEKLAERERRVIGLTFYDDCSADEIATTLGLTSANVRVIRHRALLQLRACIDSNHGGAP
jgi:RNA polymerase sigma-70 factor (ECF subfamily)